MVGYEQKADAEKAIKRNPHPDFAKVQASRPDWDEAASEWSWTKTKDPAWKPGQGGNDGGESLKKNHVEIDPHEEGRPAVFNYKLLISAIVPRFIGFVSTRSKDGKSNRQHERTLLTSLRKLYQSRTLQLYNRGQSCKYDDLSTKARPNILLGPSNIRCRLQRRL